MTYIKKLVMHGFKSFVRKTELPFVPGINTILGSNGSGKSNITDALCFVLGRLSIKSMRASKAGGLIFAGTKEIAPAKEAGVEIIFDNKDKIFTINSDEISIKRIVRKDGQSIYKINNETKTRQEILTLLAQAGIDPNGFNIILQNEIQNFVRMQTEERRKIIEEVSGISVYEIRKEKSLKELERTDDRLKEITAILRERTAYLNNLERERQQALRYKKLEEDVKRLKASRIYSDLMVKQKEAKIVDSSILEKNRDIEKLKKSRIEMETLIENFKVRISSINSSIQKSAGLEQEKLNQEIANIRAELAGMNVRLENYESKLSNILNQKQELREAITNSELSVRELQKKSPLAERKDREINLKKQELEKLEEQRKKFYTIKSELKTIKERLQDKKILMQNYTGESDFLLKQIESAASELFDKKTDSQKIEHLKISLNEKKEQAERLNREERELEKKSYADESEIEKQNKLIEKISKMDVCPLCKSKITEGHISHISQEILPKIELLKKQVSESDKKLGDILSRKEIVKKETEQMNTELSKRESDMVKISNMHEKKEQIKSIQEKIDNLNGEIAELEKTNRRLQDSFDRDSNIEEKCETLRVVIQEISMRSEENVSSEISFKQRELERSKISLKQLSREEAEINDEIKEIRKILEAKEELLEKKREQEEELSRKFQKLISERDALQGKIRESETEVSLKSNAIYNTEQELNNFKIDRARVGAEIENLEVEMLGFGSVSVIRANRDLLSQKLAKVQEILSGMGPVNLRSLEVYDSIKKEYDAVKERTDVISKEKEGIMKIIHEIDVKKKKTFLRTLESLNDIFSKNFSELSSKGEVFLELENRKEPFEGGVSIIVRTGHGKYFDVRSLSGGEQTIVALCLIFAIQELNPYHFYIFDEIDAALDKRNSARLSGLLQKYMKKGQYIIVTHNDEVIANSTNLYGVSMHDGISKIVSLKV